MATRRRPTTTKKPETSTGAKEGKVTELNVVWSRDRRLTVSVGTAADFGKIKVGLSLSENVKDSDDPMELADSIFETLTEKLEEQYDALAEKIGLEEGGYEDGPGDDPGDDDGGDDWGDEGGDDDGDGEPEEIGEEDIRKMKKDELLELIEDEQLDLDPKDYKKIGDLREAVIDALFEEDPGDDDGDDGDEGSAGGGDDDPDWDDDEWEDD